MGANHAVPVNFLKNPIIVSPYFILFSSLAISFEVDGEDPADAPLLHGDAVEHVGLLHGAPAVGDDDELGLARRCARI